MDEDTKSAVPAWMMRYPPAEITPAEFEEWIAELFSAAGVDLKDLRVSLHERIEGSDGSYDFDATVRY